jgi:hypothetical protein
LALLAIGSIIYLALTHCAKVSTKDDHQSLSQEERLITEKDTQKSMQSTSLRREAPKTDGHCRKKPESRESGGKNVISDVQNVRQRVAQNKSDIKVQPTSQFANGTPFYDFSKNKVSCVVVRKVSDEKEAKEIIAIKGLRSDFTANDRYGGTVFFGDVNVRDIFTQYPGITRVELHDDMKAGVYRLVADTPEKKVCWRIDTNNCWVLLRHDWYAAKILND